MEQPKLVERSYPEVADDVLTAIVGGVVNEPHLFDIKVADYPLSEPADPLRGIRDVTGTAAGQHRTFQPGTDYLFVAGSGATPSTLRWLPTGTLPDQGSQFLVDYYRPGQPSPLTDINVGSVTRTLAEAISREIAVVYEQINLAYLAGFVDWATGQSLDFVVAILGVTRLGADYTVGEVTFFRDASVAGAITIDDGISLVTSDNKVTFKTTEQRTLQPGQSRVNVPVRAEIAGDGGIVDANTITQLPIPIAGIERVTNLDATRRAAAPETDDELRRRAKAKLRGLSQCTVVALELAALNARATDVEVRDPQYPEGDPTKWTPPGTAQVLIKGNPDRFQATRDAIDGARAAGVAAQVVARLVIFTPRISITPPASVTPAGRAQLQRDIVAAIQGYVATVASGEPVLGARLRGAVAQAVGVPEAGLGGTVKLRDVMVWMLEPENLANPGVRVPNRALLQRGGQPATDAEIQSWDFDIVTTIDGKKALPVLNLTPDDVVFDATGTAGG